LGLVNADLEWSITPTAKKGAKANDGLPQSFAISLNNATLSREYQLGPRQVKPTSNLMLDGVRNTPIKLHDEIFDQMAVPNAKPRTAQDRRDDANAAMGGNVRNIFEIGGSNYQDQISMFKNVGTLVDAVWLIGCSIGSTRYEGGIEGLARTRTKVVADWLKLSGMDAERLYEESCWAEEPEGLNMPRRGVQLTLLRERKN